MKCPKCNQEIPDNLRYCIYCGSSTVLDAAQERIRKGKLALSKKYSYINFDDYTHENYMALKAIERELEQYDPNITHEMVRKIRQTINQCDSLYKKEAELLATIQQEERNLSFSSKAKLFIKNLLLFWLVGIIAFAFLNGWLMGLVCLGCFGAPFIETGDKIKERKESLDCHEAELASIQRSINGNK